MVSGVIATLRVPLTVARLYDTTGVPVTARFNTAVVDHELSPYAVTV